MTPLPDSKFSIIYADPPWEYERTTFHRNRERTFDPAYGSMSLDDLKALPVAAIAERDCLLFLWVTGPLLPDALDLGAAWGFSYGTIAFVWDKGLTLPGSYTISQCELCLAFRKGRIPQPRGDRNVRQMLYERRKAHSAKPQEVRDRIVRMFPTQRKIELFGRVADPNWTVWGDQTHNAGKQDLLA